jgi:hypothetical protein
MPKIKQQSTVQYSNEEPVQSDFLLDLRRQIINEKKPSSTRRLLNKKIRLKFKWSRPVWRFNIISRSKFDWLWRKEIRIKIKWPTIKRPRLSIKISRPKTLRPIFSFLIIFLLIILPFKLVAHIQDLQSIRSRVVSASNDGLVDLKTASQLLANQDFLAASLKFDQASASFEQAGQDLNGIQSWLWQLALVVPTSQTRLAASAPLIAQAGDLSGKLGNDLTNLVHNIVSGSNKGDTLAIVRQINLDSHQALADGLALKEVVNKINPTNLPQGYRDQLINWQSKLGLLTEYLQQIEFWSAAALDLLGEKMDRRYLLVFQNNAEARASGGFVGSYALLDLKQGKIKNLEIPKGGSYDTDGNLRRFVNPPLPMRLVSVYWKFWDANWWPDWPASANQLAWFLHESNGPTVDGVIGLTPDVLEDLLKLTGPIDLSQDHGLIVSADNFRLTVQDHVENKVSGETQPKKIIGDLAVAIMEKIPTVLSNQEIIIELAKNLSDQIVNKHILFYFNNQAIQTKWEQTGLSGQLEQLERGQDYLQVVNTNIAGGKTDLKIRQTVEQRVEIQSDGSLINDVTIIREHTGEKQEGLYGVRNVNWLRLYVPEGSQLLSADGFSQPDDHFFRLTDPAAEDLPALKAGEGSAVIDQASGTLIYDELGRTVFANWSMIDAGQTARLNFRYRLPFNLLDSYQTNWLSKIKAYFGLGRFGQYQLIIENQAGQQPTSWKIMWRWPMIWNLLWSAPGGIVSDNWRVDKISGRLVVGLLFKVDK